MARWCNLPGTGEDLLLKSGVNGATPDTTCGKRVEPGQTVLYQASSPASTFATSLGAVIYQLHDASAPPAPVYPGLRLDRADATIALLPLGAGATTSLTVPTWVSNLMIRTQVVMLANHAANGLYAASNALDIWVP